ncbi:class B sortase [Clostridium perfringens]|uniref:class B sortase n=1 Tax=Clostridium perfringens TaxID=1502 RepID=UPI0039ED2A8D
MKVINILRKILKCFIILIFLISLFNIAISIKKYSDGRKVYNDIRYTKEKENLDLKKINSDYMGWINIENTPIDYPVVKGKDNEFYLTRDFNKKYLASGSIFMDYRNKDFQDKNVVIYGHHMRDKSMFGSLKKFKGIEYLKNNKYINIINNNGETLKYEIFGLYVTSTDDTECISTNFNSDEEFNSYIEGVLSKSIYDENISIKNTDKLLTLSTCSYEFDNARLLVHAKLIK